MDKIIFTFLFCLVSSTWARPPAPPVELPRMDIVMCDHRPPHYLLNPEILALRGQNGWITSRDVPDYQIEEEGQITTICPFFPHLRAASVHAYQQDLKTGEWYAWIYDPQTGVALGYLSPNKDLHLYREATEEEANDWFTSRIQARDLQIRDMEAYRKMVPPSLTIKDPNHISTPADGTAQKGWLAAQ